MERYELQAVVRRLYPHHRVGACLRSLQPERTGVEVFHAPHRGSAHYGGLMVCGNVWMDPVCACKVGERRRDELAAAIEAHRARGGVVLIAAYTVSHGRNQGLADILGRFLKAYHHMTGNRPYKRLAASYGLVGTIKALEVTWGEVNGWHPHCHVLLFLDGVGVDLRALQADLYGAWSSAAARRGLTMTARRGLVVQSTWGAVYDYVAKWGKLPARRLWDATDEMTKAHRKRARADVDGERFTPFDLLRWVRDTGEAAAAGLFREFAVVFSGGRRRQLVWSPGLRRLLGLVAEASDEEVAARQEDDAYLLGRLDLEQWRVVRLYEQRGELLEVARGGDWSAVQAFVTRLWHRHGVMARGGVAPGVLPPVPPALRLSGGVA